MDIFFYILKHNILPIYIVVILGFILGKKFDLNVATLSKMNFFIFVPSFIFVNLYETKLGIDIVKITSFCTIYLLVNDVLARLFSRMRNYDLGMSNAFKNSLLFHNVGNIGLSLVTLVYSSGPFLIDGHTPYLNDALATLIIILVFANISMNTLGFYNAGRSKMNVRHSLKQIFSMPSIYAIPLAFLLKSLDYDMHENAVWPALVYLKNGLIPIALLTLGVQLSKTRFGFTDTDVQFSVFTRLFVGPILALGFVRMFGFTGVVAQTVFIAHSVPTAVNTALIAIECNNHQEFATQAVVWSTLLSAATLTLAVYVAWVVFPV